MGQRFDTQMDARVDSASAAGAGIRLFADQPLAAGAAVPLSADQAHYLRNVMRVKAGGALRVFNPRDGEWTAVLETLDKKAATCRVGEQVRAPAPEPDVWLVFAPIKHGRIDYLAQKASELGASALQPVFTRRTAMSRINLDRLRANAVEAAEQCERLSVPTVFEPRKLGDLLDGWPGDRRVLLCDESGAAPPVAAGLAPFRDGPAEPWAVFVGPEGGYAPEELDAIRKLPIVTPVSLGGRVLRADTAGVAALACWQALIGDWTGDPD